MEARTCSRCGQDWYSADTVTVWVCSRCGAKMPPIETIKWPGFATTLPPKSKGTGGAAAELDSESHEVADGLVGDRAGGNPASLLVFRLRGLEEYK